MEEGFENVAKSSRSTGVMERRLPRCRMRRLASAGSLRSVLIGMTGHLASAFTSIVSHRGLSSGLFGSK